MLIIKWLLLLVDVIERRKVAKNHVQVLNLPTFYLTMNREIYSEYSF